MGVFSKRVAFHPSPSWPYVSLKPFTPASSSVEVCLEISGFSEIAGILERLTVSEREIKVIE